VGMYGTNRSQLRQLERGAPTKDDSIGAIKERLIRERMACRVRIDEIDERLLRLAQQQPQVHHNELLEEDSYG
jgi:hypothetical protein